MTITDDQPTITDDDARRLLTTMAEAYDRQQANPSEHITIRCRAAARTAAVEWVYSDNPQPNPDHSDTLTRWRADLRYQISNPTILHSPARKAEVFARAEAVKWAIQHTPEVPGITEES